MTESTGQLENHARTVVHHIAQELSDIKSWQPVSRNIRTQTVIVAADMYGYSSYANAVGNVARAMMPPPRPDETRGEYAIRCRTGAGRVTTA